MNGSAPKDPATGSHVDVTRNCHPKAAIARRDSHASEITRPAASRITAQTAARTTQSKTRSPERPRARPDARTLSASLAAVLALELDADGIRDLRVLLRGQQRLAGERDLLD